MSFDVYVQFFRDGAEAGVSPDAVRAAFPGAGIEVVDEDYWRLGFGAEDTDLFVRPAATDAALLHSLAFHRPARDARLWDGIWSLLAVPGAVFHFPGGAGPVVRHAAAIAAMPAALREALGAAVIASDMAELVRAVEAAA